MDETFADQFNTNDESVAGAKSDQKGEGVAPVIISQILACEDTNFKMWGMTFGMISTVAIVRNIESASTRLTYLLEDFSGQITAHLWVDEDDTSKSPDIMVNSYARVYGTLRKFDGKKTIMIFKMFQVGSINEVTTHFLEVLNARYKAEQYSKKGLSDFSSTVGGPVSNISNQQDSANSLGLSGKQFAVYQAIKTESTKGDVSVQSLQRKFNHISMQELKSIVEFLAQEGHIYASVDSDHYLCTDS